MTLDEIMNSIHEECVENEVFELLAQWFIMDRFEKMKKINERGSALKAINKIAKQNKNAKQAIDAIICLSEEENEI